MSKINFFTALKYENPNRTYTEYFTEKVDNYFYLGGKKAHVLQGRTKNGSEKIILSETNSSIIARVAKRISYLSLIIPLLMLLAKAILRSKKSFKIVDAKAKLEKGMNIPDSTIQELTTKLKYGIKKDDSEINLISDGNNTVFNLVNSPNLIFKISRGSSSNERFENMVKAKEICLIHELGLMTIPHAKHIEIEGVGNVIVEERLDFEGNESAQEDFYHHTYSTDLNETARQVAIFIAKTGFNDVTWRNIPILNENQGFKGDRRVGLIDLEHMKSVDNGFLGDINGSCGLIECVSEKQVDIVVKEARKNGVFILKSVLDRKKEKVQSDIGMRKFHQDGGIVTGKEPIQVNIDSLNLDLTEEDEIKERVFFQDGTHKNQTIKVTLKKVAQDVVDELNKLISEKSDHSSVKGMRDLYLGLHDHPFSEYGRLGVPRSQFYVSPEDEKKFWIYRIIEALIEKKIIYKLETFSTGTYYRIQL